MRDHRGEKVTFGVVHGGHPTMPWVVSTWAMFDRDAYTGHRRFDHPSKVIVQSGTNVAVQRNAVVRLFLEGTADWLLFIDDDEPFSPDIVDKLVASADPDERPILSALVMAEKWSPHYRIVPACVGFESLDPLVPREYDRIPTERHWRVGAAGAGALLIHRSVLVAMGEQYAEDAWPWFKFMQAAFADDPKPDVLGEDYGFCLRAAALGFPTHIDTTIEVGHIKPRTLTTADFWRQYPADAAEPKVFAVIPTKGKAPKYLKGLLRDLREQGEAADVFVIDNGTTGEIERWLHGQDWLTIVDMPDAGIHEMWNAGIELARSRWPTWRLAFLNDDIKIGPKFLSRMSRAFDADPMCAAVCANHDERDAVAVQPLQGIYADGKNPMGLAGWAFMVRSEWFATGFRFPEECRWWYGDNFLTVAVDLAGGWYGLVPDATCEHLGGATGDWDSPELAPILAADRFAFERACKEIGVEVRVV